MAKIINNPNLEKIKIAADILKNGGLVVFPTETVYGLGANGLDATAVQKIFLVKGRPADNPLILHISDISQLESIAINLPQNIDRLAQFMPGPLTLVLEKSKHIPDIVTAGLNTVAVRIPSHPIARDLIAQAGVPVAAPSANISGRPSPTTAQHTIDDLHNNPFVEVIIDGGPCEIGVESTILDLSSKIPTILREGAITRETLELEIGTINAANSTPDKPKAPGMKYTHYAPHAPLFIVKNIDAEIKKHFNKKIGVLSLNKNNEKLINNENNNLFFINLGNSPEEYAANLYACLRKFDELNVDIIFSEEIIGTGICAAVRNRLYKASKNK